MPYLSQPHLVRAVTTPVDNPEMRHWNTGGSATFAWPEANLAVAVPWLVEVPTLVKRLIVANGVPSGNTDVGIYRYDLSRIVSTGSTAGSGSNVMQLFDVTDTLLLPGRYYLAVAIDNTTGTIYRYASTAASLRIGGFFQMSSAFPLPTTLTPAAIASDLYPLCGTETLRVL